MIPWLIMWYEVYIFIRDYPEVLDLIPWWAWSFLIEYWLLFWCFPITLYR